MKPYKRIFLFSSFVFLFSIPCFGIEKDEYGKKYLSLYMGIQHQEVLAHLPPGAEFLGDFRSVVEGQLDRERKTLVFVPKKPGIGTLTIHDRKGKKLFEYRVEVRVSDLTRVVREVRGLLKDIEGITIKIVNKKVIIDGKVLMPRDLNRIYGVMNQYDKLVDSLVEINPIAQKKIAEIIERHINNPDVEVRAVNGKFILKGIVNSPSEKTNAEKIARTYVPVPFFGAAEKAEIIKKKNDDLIINMLNIRAKPPAPPKKIIQLVVHYVQMSKRYLKSSSFRWSPSLKDNTDIGFTKDTRKNSDGIVAEISGVISNLLPKLNSAKEHGYARVLESTSVTTTEGKPGLVSSGTKIPYVVSVPTGNGGAAWNTQFENVGINSKITPTIISQRSDLIQLSMEFSVSSILEDTAQGPKIAQNKVQTIVNVRGGQSAAIGGLIRNISGTAYNPDSDEDALFNLYSGKRFRRDKAQFVVFVTPFIKASASAGSEKIKQKFRLRE